MRDSGADTGAGGPDQTGGADSAAFAKSKEEYRTKMINLARQDRIRGYMGALRQAAKIVDNRAKLQQQQQAAQTQQPPII